MPGGFAAAALTLTYGVGRPAGVTLS